MLPHTLDFVALLFAVSPAHADTVDLSVFHAGLENRAGLVFTPDGQTAYWTEWNGVWGGKPTSPHTLYASSREDGQWSEPAPLSFSGTYHDDAPYVSPDGRWLYFVSDRPRTAGDTRDEQDIWRFSLEGEGLLEHLAINSDAAEYSPVVTESGALYFASARSGGSGQGDLYRSAPEGSDFASPELLGPSVNSETGEWNLWVADDESEMLFEASSRSTNLSVSGDLYYSRRTSAGWSEAIPVTSINSKGSDLLPRVHPDGKTLYYTQAPIGGHARLVARPWATLKRQLRPVP